MDRFPHPLVGKVAQWLRQRAVPPGGLVVAVSGGPDSVALLHALLALRSGTEPLVVAHLNHQLRGADSAADEAFVRDLVTALEAARPGLLRLRCEQIDVAAEAAAAGANLEETARRLRYDWLARVAQEAGLALVATGHTADDQAETVLHHLLRGTGLKGLRGMAARRPLTAAVDLIRPLLTVTRAEVLDYLAAQRQPFRQDLSNLDRRFTRNRLRQELLPHLAAQYNPAISSVLTRLAAQADEVHRELESQAAQALAAAERPRAGAVLVLDRGVLATVSRPLRREVFRLIWEREGWPLGRMTFAHWDRLAALTEGGRTADEFPGGVRVRCREHVLQLVRHV